MSIVTVFRPPSFFAQEPEAQLRLRLNRSNRYFFYSASHMSDAEWEEFRDAEIQRVMSELSWEDITQTLPGEIFELSGGMGKVLARRAEDDPNRFDILHVSARQNVYDRGSWFLGDPPREEWITEEILRQRWNEYRSWDWQAIFDARWERRG